MTLADLARPAQKIFFGHWNRELTIRPLGGRAMLRLMQQYADLHGADATINTPQLVDFYGDLLAAVVEEPKADADDWKDNATLPDLIDLGVIVLQAIGLAAVDTKKN